MDDRRPQTTDRSRNGYGPRSVVGGLRQANRGRRTMRTMAVDVGDKRIGVAVSDPEGILAQGLTVIEHRSRRADLEALAILAQEQEAAEIVIGYPLLLSGRAGEQAQAVRRFGKELQKRARLPVVFWDERLSTVAAHRLMREAGVPGRRRAGRVDAVAAEWILQSYLDWRRNTRASEGQMPPSTQTLDAQSFEGEM